MAQTCALIAPVQPVLHRVLCSNDTLTNAPKHYETHQNMSSRSNGVDRVHSLPKIPMRLRGATFALIAPVQHIFHRVSCSNETIQNALKHYKTHQFMSLASNGVDRVHSLRKTLMRFRGTNLCINCTSSTRFAPSGQMHPNTTKTHQNMSLGSDGVDRVCSLPKIPMRVHGTNFCINCTSSA